MRHVLIIAIVAVAMIGVMVPSDVFAQQKPASMSISADSVLTERYGNEFTVNFDGKLRDNGKIYWHFSGSGGSGLEILPTDTTSWTKILSSTGPFTIGNTQFFEIKNGAYSEKFEFTVISKEDKNSVITKTIVPIFEKCKNGLWIGHFEDEHTEEQIKNAKVFLYNDKGLRFATFGLHSDGTLKIFPNGDDNYPATYFVTLRVENYEDLSFTPECVGTPEIPSWVKQTASWWSMNVIADNEFISMIQFLIKSELIIISHTSNVSENNPEIPSWIKSSAGWWAEDIIDDITFLKSIEFLVSNGMINVQTNNISQNLDVVENQITSDEGFSGLYCKQERGLVVMTGKYTNGPNYYSSIWLTLGVLDNQDRIVDTALGIISDVGPYQTKMFKAQAEWSGDFKECIIELDSVFP